jgi:hypothetical protein
MARRPIAAELTTVYDPMRIIKAFSNCAAVKRIAKIRAIAVARAGAAADRVGHEKRLDKRQEYLK